MTGRMADAGFRDAQRAGMYLPHVAPVNRIVDGLIDPTGRGWAAHVAPVHGGTRARLLWVLRDPGPATADPDRADAGFLCVENDDPTAKRLRDLLDRAGIDVTDTLPWNAYPWYVNRPPNAGELRFGVEPLRALLGLLDRLRVVLLLGRHAERSWGLLADAHPEALRGLHVLRARRPGRQAFIGTAEQRDLWREEQALTFEQARRLLDASRT